MRRCLGYVFEVQIPSQEVFGCIGYTYNDRLGAHLVVMIIIQPTNLTSPFLALDQIFPQTPLAIQTAKRSIMASEVLSDFSGY